jgi:hypothetical protein
VVCGSGWNHRKASPSGIFIGNDQRRHSPLPEGPLAGHWPVARRIGRRRGFPLPPPPPWQSATEALLGQHAETAARLISEAWREAISSHWAERHGQTQLLSAELAKLDQPASTPRSVDELWAKASTLLGLNDAASAAPVLDEVLAMNPKHVAANFARGRLWLEQEDPRGIACIESALETDPMLTPDGLGLMHSHFVRTGQRDRLRPLEDRIDRFQEQAVLGERERANISMRDTFMAHELTPEQVAGVQAIFQNEPDIGAAAIVRKQVQHFPQSPAFVVALRIKVPWWKPRSTSADQKLVNRVVEKMELPGYSLVIVAEQNLKRVAKKIFTLPGAVVHTRHSR